MAKRQNAFTLIELMVVVAIIAILATLSVSNFSTAIRRTRNTQRVSDIQAVAKAMETCYNVMTGAYGVATGDYTATTSSADGFFKRSNLTCLNNDIQPTVDAYPYNGSVKTVNGTIQTFFACAKLEQVDGWEGVGNSTSNAPGYSATSGQVEWTLTACSSTSTDCYFCATGQQ